MLRRSVPLRVPCPAGGFFLVEWDICLKLAESTARKTQRRYAAALPLEPVQNPKTRRWDLSLRIAGFHTRYSDDGGRW